ncbi:hypothetical protein Q4E93_32940 [Flavitalea sp. BT771]|uniref:hypothetical protein n=1 Tax=Flavitalea sp. BT771 TaxID=3063329 RepID=UPI0026E22F56|nr:hypothetical protein [Flavitalea sp. BT771]MDO6435467.1 hypothetical protein [Flavitalea sp. BT771]MDV6224367.1 hypothetical protein [Flavitalea sp. BT771]
MPPKTALLCTIAFCLILLSCHKSDSSSQGNPVNNSYLASCRSYATDYLQIDSLRYDANHHLIRLDQYVKDNSNGNQIDDSLNFVFTYAGNGSLPTGYEYAHEQAGQYETHQLTYDGQNRIVKDTGVNGSGYVTYFAYPGDKIVATVSFDGSVDGSQIDTLTVSGGNVTQEKVYINESGSWNKQGDVAFGHVAGANPGYKAEIAGSLGPLLYILQVNGFGGYSDYISKSLTNKVTGTAEGLPGAGINYTVGVDATGRISSITPAGAPAGTKMVFTYY